MKDTTLLIMSALASWLAPIAPVLGVFAILVCADVVTAYMLCAAHKHACRRNASARPYAPSGMQPWW